MAYITDKVGLGLGLGKELGLGLGSEMELVPLSDVKSVVRWAQCYSKWKAGIRVRVASGLGQDLGRGWIRELGSA
eukprot:1392836-Amorphochlora_amoeboformis.AAC.1